MNAVKGAPGLSVAVDLPGRLVAQLRAAPGERLAVVGANGAGKTTLLRVVAGTTAGRVSWAGADWSGLPPQARSVGLVHQDHQLFPHLDALENVAFGPRARGVPRRRARRHALEWLDRLGIADHAHHRPGQLSGGQAQRVAIARTLANSPDVLLLDEPFAALDVAVAIDLREVIAEHLRDYPGVALLATHDALDVDALATRVVVLEDGRIAQDGDPAQVAEAPSTAHAARMLGLNVLRGVAAADGSVALHGGGVLHTGGATAGPVLAVFAPSAVTLTRDVPVGSARNAWPVQVLGTAAGTGQRAGVVRVHLHGTPPDGAGIELRADVTASSTAALEIAAGARLWASVKATEVAVFDVPTTPGRPINSGP